MTETAENIGDSKFRRFIKKREKYIPVIFFIGGFIFDTLTLGRIDRLYDVSILCLHMTNLTITLFLFNLAGDGKWENTLIGRYEKYFPLAIQFFFGALSSAYVIYFSRSVSLSKTASFFVILVTLLIANEFLKKRISNKYLQFSVYFFISFTFFAFMIPVLIKEMSTQIFLISGGVSLGVTLILITIIYLISPSTRTEIRIGRLIGIVLTIYAVINGLYFLKLIPPVPIALSDGMVAYNVQEDDKHYIVTYDAHEQYVFWRDHRLKFIHQQEDKVYVFSSIFAPTNIKKSIFHRWKWFNEATDEWETMDNIGYDITGGRDEGYRGYTYKNNVREGAWKVEVMTEEELIIGVIDFEIIVDTVARPKQLVERRF